MPRPGTTAAAIAEQQHRTWSRCPIKDGQIYSVLGYYNGDNYLHLSYEERSGWCRQVYDKASDSKFQFTVNNVENNTWFIQNKSGGRRLGHWLSYDNQWVGLWALPINR